jgi:hypothetical protein
MVRSIMRCVWLMAAIASTAAFGGQTLDNADLRLTLDDDGSLTVLHKATGREWKGAGTSPVRDAARAADGALRWRQTLSGGKQTFDAQLGAALDGPTVRFTLAIEPTAPAATLAWPPALNATLDAGQIAFTPYMDGVLLPQTSTEFPGWAFGPAYDLPFVALLDGQRGDGYLLLPETPYDSQIRVGDVAGKRVPQTLWLPEMGLGGPTRAVRLVFVPSGGYVALAKVYRDIARAEGLLVTLAGKQKARPQLARLAGAPDVWGSDAQWAREAWAAGVEHCLDNFTADRAAMTEINDRGWLTSRYDNYADMFIEPDKSKWDNTRGADDEVLLKPDGKQQLAWLTYDKMTQYLKRSGRAMLAAAQRSIPPDLEKHPYLARFLDVTTADALLEDYRPGGRQTRSQDVANRLALFRYVNARGLVTGGEHGRSWAVPTMDYFEGMMSGNPFFSWPAGHLLKPEGGLKGISDKYRQYGIGGAARIPLWELVFHDCAVSYWYWGDSTDYLHELDPAITDRKDAENVLYGTPPMYWLNHLGFQWKAPDGRGKARLLQSYRVTCPWHEAVFGREMLSHEALTPDRLVQRTTFAGGYEAVANLSDEARVVSFAGSDMKLPPNGFAARGPGVWVERRVADDGRVIIRVKTPTFAAIDGGGKATSLDGMVTSGRAAVVITAPDRVDVAAGSDAVAIEPAKLVAGWSDAGRRVFRLGADGGREDYATVGGAGGKIEVPAGEQRLEIACGTRTDMADVAITLSQRQADGHSAVEFKVTNAGRRAVPHARLKVTVDGEEQPQLALPLKAPANLAKFSGRLSFDPMVYDGRRCVTASIEDPDHVPEMLASHKEASLWVDFGFDPRGWMPKPVAIGNVTGLGGPCAGRVVSAALHGPLGAAPQSLRVIGPDGQPLPAQREADGNLVVALPADATDQNGGLRLEVLGRSGALYPLDRGQHPPGGSFWRPAMHEIVTPVYRCSMADGLLTNLTLAGAPHDLWDSLVYSSPETGWVDENGVTEACDVLADGPVRAILRVRRNLAGGKAIVTKTYTFYADALIVDTDAAPSVTGLHNRIYYGHEPLDLADSLGRHITIDGQGDDKLHGGNPAWIAVFGPHGGHSIVPLTKADGVTFWDAGNWGGLGYGGDKQHSRVGYVFHPEARDATFAAADADRFGRQPVLTLTGPSGG